jgi:hypothetical protein
VLLAVDLGLAAKIACERIGFVLLADPGEVALAAGLVAARTLVLLEDLFAAGRAFGLCPSRTTPERSEQRQEHQERQEQDRDRLRVAKTPQHGTEISPGRRNASQKVVKVPLRAQ